MRKFINRILLFGLYIISPIAIALIGSHIVLNNPKYWKLPTNKDYIVLGHSHPECAFNDTLISGLVNLGKSGESYFYTYLKAKKIIPNNKTLKAVFIEFGNSNIGRGMDSWIWDDKHIQQNFPRYFSLLDYSDFKILAENNFKAILNCPPSRFIKEIGYTYMSSLILRKNFRSNTRFGGYNYLKANKVELLVKDEMSSNRDNNIIEKDISEINIKYLQKIVELCNENNIKAFLIRSPVHSKYFSIYNEVDFNRVLKAYFQNTEFIDFASFPLQNNEYRDFGHLNYQGAHKFSIWFNSLLMNNFLKEKDKQLIVHKSIKTLTEKSL